jgi:hypothetical protein
MQITAAKRCLGGVKIIQLLGLQIDDLIPSRMKITATDDNVIPFLGAALLRLSAQDTNGDVHDTRQMTYITKSPNDRIFLSREACVDLQLIPSDFPTVSNTSCSTLSLHDDEGPRNCPQRQKPPPLPTILPFLATEENRQILKKYLLEYYHTTTF